MKATSLLAKHDKSEWHKATVKNRSVSNLAQKHSSVVEQIL